MTPIYIYVLHVVGSALFLSASVWNIFTHVEPTNVFYVYAAGSTCFLVAATTNLVRRLK